MMIFLKRTPELDKLFNEIKISFSKYAELAITTTTHLFYITVYASLFGLGAILFQSKTDSNMQVLSYNSRISSTQEQTFSTYDRELCAITFALSHYDFLIIGSKFSTNVFTYHTLFFFALHLKETSQQENIKLN